MLSIEDGERPQTATDVKPEKDAGLQAPTYVKPENDGMPTMPAGEAAEEVPKPEQVLPGEGADKQAALPGEQSGSGEDGEQPEAKAAETAEQAAKAPADEAGEDKNAAPAVQQQGLITGQQGTAPNEPVFGNASFSSLVVHAFCTTKMPH